MPSGLFSNLSDTYEPRTIFRTVADIALDAYNRDPLSSFFLIGASDSRDRKSATTRRFRVYASFVNNLNLTHLFRSYTSCQVALRVSTWLGAMWPHGHRSERLS